MWGGKYDDAREVLDTQCEMMSDFAVWVENAKDAADIVPVLETCRKIAA